MVNKYDRATNCMTSQEQCVCTPHSCPPLGLFYQYIFIMYAVPDPGRRKFKALKEKHHFFFNYNY